MKRFTALLIMGVLAFTACKTTKQAAQPSASNSTTPPKVFTVPTNETNNEPATTKAEPATVVDEKPISIRKEQVTFTQQEDKSTNENNSYFVIIGSFGQLQNAKNYRETLLNEGFTPIILHSETGYYRVCVNSFKSEAEARTRVSSLRQAYPKYSDVWLLIKE